MNILFVCTGNTCRSPMAEGYLKSLDIPDITVKSGGLAADGSPVSENANAVCREKGIDISGHISKQLTKEDIDWADKIICMSETHKAYLEEHAPEKLSVLGGGISDPFICGIEVYRACRDEIFTAIDELFKPFSIVPAKREHINQIAKLESICFSEPWSAETLLDAMSHGTKLLVAEKGGKVLGYVGISCILDEGYITNIAVFPESRKIGVGTALINKLFDLAKELSLSFISLEVRESNLSAISLYKKLGFSVVGTRKNFYRDPIENASIMTKRFETNENFSN